METSNLIFLNTAKIFSDNKIADFPRSKPHKQYTPYDKIPHNEFPGLLNYHAFAQNFGSNLAFIDRSNTLVTPFKLSLPTYLEMPEYETVSYTYEECVDARAKQIIELDKEIVVFYGGGIDSITILTALKRHVGSDRITVALSEDSIYTEERFFKQHIEGQHKIWPSIEFPYYLGCDDYVCVTGEGNDELCGTNYTKRLIIKYGIDILDEIATREQILKLINTTDRLNLSNHQQAEKHCDYLFKIAEKSPVKLQTVHQFFWWINFCLNWNTKQTRLLGFIDPAVGGKTIKPEVNYINFFATKEFQLWSMNCVGSEHTKQQAKQYIDIPELFTKGKINNLNTICYNKPMAFAINSDLKYFESMSQFEPQDFLTQDNSFL